MPENLLSMFPLSSADNAFARLTCLDFSCNNVTWAVPRLMQRVELEHALAAASLPAPVEEMLSSLEEGFPVQLTIADESARQLGFWKAS